MNFCTVPEVPWTRRRKFIPSSIRAYKNIIFMMMTARLIYWIQGMVEFCTTLKISEDHRYANHQVYPLSDPQAKIQTFISKTRCEQKPM